LLTSTQGPVWQVQWSHPKFQSVLASCSYDRSVIVWRETAQNVWSEVFRHVHDLSVNSVSWAPHDFGLVLAAASSDGHISVVSFRADVSAEASTKFLAHAAGVCAVSWSPPAAAFGGGAAPVKRFVSGGCDNLVCVWRLSDMNEWRKECALQGHTDWVRDVAWAPSVGGVAGTIASASQDKTVAIWREEGPANWKKSVIQFESVPWRVSWSVTGNILAVSCDDNSVSLFKEGLAGEWQRISQEQATQQ
jgi:protein transport protein SEC13